MRWSGEKTSERAVGSACPCGPIRALPRDREGGREGAVHEADLSGGGSVSPTSRRSPPVADGEGGREVAGLSRERVGGREGGGST